MSRSKLNQSLIAPCGMNCGVCRAHLRSRNSCPGCKYIRQDQVKTLVQCRLRLCNKRKGKFCFSCEDFPCEKLRQMDTRYRNKYGMSEIDNLIYIRDNGIREFLARERDRWCSDQGIFCVHDKKHYK